MKNLIFLLGVPRSGTTLLQRVLSAHPDVASVAEPWVLLPLVTCFDSEYTRSVYGHMYLDVAIADLKVEAINFQQQYDAHLRSFVESIYTPLRGDRKYFLDKTPRYYLIAEELHRLFPNAKFIYLFRNPIDVYDSVIDTFHYGKLDGLQAHYLDVTEGLNLLCKPFEHAEVNALRIRYEDLCSEGEHTIRQLCAYLELEYRPEILSQYSKVHFSGKLGDPKRNLFDSVTVVRRKQPLSLIRRHLYSKWLTSISETAWETTGYNHDEVREQLLLRPIANVRQQLDDLKAYVSIRNEMRRIQQLTFVRRSKYGEFFY